MTACAFPITVMKQAVQIFSQLSTIVKATPLKTIFLKSERGVTAWDLVFSLDSDV